MTLEAHISTLVGSLRSDIFKYERQRIFYCLSCRGIRKPEDFQIVYDALAAILPDTYQITKLPNFSTKGVFEITKK